MRNALKIAAVTGGLGLAFSLAPALAASASTSASTSAPLAASVAVPAGAATLPEVAHAAPSQPKITYFTYRTFIDKKFADRFPCVLKNRKFGGDGRGFSTAANAGHRTSMTVGINWTAQKGLTKKSVGVMKLYDSKGKLVSSKKPATNGMKFGRVVIARDTARFTLDHSVANPFCTSGATRYKVTVTLHRDGRYSLNGQRRKSPHHEAFIRFDGNFGKAHWVLRKKNHDFKCLTSDATCGLERLAVSGKAR